MLSNNICLASLKYNFVFVQNSTLHILIALLLQLSFIILYLDLSRHMLSLVFLIKLCQMEENDRSRQKNWAGRHSARMCEHSSQKICPRLCKDTWNSLNSGCGSQFLNYMSVSGHILPRRICGKYFILICDCRSDMRMPIIEQIHKSEDQTRQEISL